MTTAKFVIVPAEFETVLVSDGMFFFVAFIQQFMILTSNNNQNQKA